MTDQDIARRQLRRSYPSPAPDLASLDDGALAEWLRTCMFQDIAHTRWSIAGWRWRRARDKANRAFYRRVLSDAGTPRRSCSNCGERPSTRHVVYPPVTAPRFGHYCEVCSPSMPIGWMCIGEFR